MTQLKQANLKIKELQDKLVMIQLFLAIYEEKKITSYDLKNAIKQTILK